MSNRVYIFDTTLRDGEQSPGVSLNINEKLQIARQLARLGVDIIEAGFPITSPGDFAAVQAVAREVRGVTVAGLARANFKDIDGAWEAVRDAEQARIHTFIATSDIHLKYKLRKDREQVIEAAVAAVKHAKKYTSDVEFSAEDASRSDVDYLARVSEKSLRPVPPLLTYRTQWAIPLQRNLASLSRPLWKRPPALKRLWSACTATMIWVWRWPTPWLPLAMGYARLRAPLTA
ncbi:hypothetical protein N752_10635 [Desulforamulus aquiferis]|nr:hypothetical protein N752_10635 [Desulforamulus aquiferis]